QPSSTSAPPSAPRGLWGGLATFDAVARAEVAARTSEGGDGVRQTGHHERDASCGIGHGSIDTARGASGDVEADAEGGGRRRRKAPRSGPRGGATLPRAPVTTAESRVTAIGSRNQAVPLKTKRYFAQEI